MKKKWVIGFVLIAFILLPIVVSINQGGGDSTLLPWLKKHVTTVGEARAMNARITGIPNQDKRTGGQREVLLSSDPDKPFVLDWKNGDGCYGVEFHLAELGGRYKVWDPEGHMPKPLILGDNDHLNLDKGDGVKIRVLHIWAVDGTKVLKYTIY